MSKKFRFEFECGHAANATNEEAMRVIRHGGKVYRFCPRCWSRVERAIDRCISSGAKRRSAIRPLPDAED